jgi:flagellar biosynthetic protein FlhB
MERVVGYAVQTFALAGTRITAGSLHDLATRSLLQVAAVTGPVLGLVVLGAVLSNVAQVGFSLSMRPLTPKLSRLDPLQGWKRLLTARSAVELGKGLVKVTLVAVCAWRYLTSHWDSLFALVVLPPEAIGPRVGDLAHGLALRIVSLLTLLAAFDYAFQRWQLERSLRMTRQEIKEEVQEAEGRPEVRSRIRAQQRQLSRRRMMADVVQSSVVITNPTHYAIALSYRLGESAGAPKVVAKGRDRIARKIREVAAQHGVPCVENAPLARSLYQAVEIGQEIPPALYRAVAEVLALLWRTRSPASRPGSLVARSEAP